MKPTKTLALLASLAFAGSAFAQTTIIEDAVQNGDLETGVAAPFVGNAGTISTLQNHSTGGSNSIEVDLTGNNGNAQWKGITDNPSGPVPADDDLVTHSLWVYVPAATSFPNGVNGDGPGGLDTNDLNTQALLVINLQRSLDGGANFGNVGPVANGAYQSLNLKNVARDTWVQLQKTDVNMEAGTTDIRVNHNFQNSVLIGPAGGLVAADGGDDTGSGADLAGPAVAGDWQASGYDGVIYLDDFVLTTEAAPTPPPAGTLICDEFTNGNFEAAQLSPWNPARMAGSIETTIVQEGVQSMEVELSADGLATNRWRGFQLGNLQLPAVDGDTIGTAMYVYVPSTTTFGPGRANVRAELRSDKDTSGNGNQANALSINLKTVPTDVWTLFSKTTTVVDGTQTLSSINTSGWNIETENGVDQLALGYNGPVYFDDVKLLNLGQGSDPEGTIIGPNTNNGDMEGAGPEPFNTLDPFGASAAVATTAFNNTVGGNQSICVDLTAPNNNQRWKGFKGTITAVDVLTPGYNTVDVSAWVYIPTATTFGTTALLNLPIKNDFDAGQAIGSPSFDLTGAARDTWVEVSATGLDLLAMNNGNPIESLATNNWNIETLKLVGPAGMLVGSDGTDRTGDATDPADLAGPVTPADWNASGYDGFFYIDDISVFAYNVATGDPISVNSITYDGTDVVINYNTSFTAAGFSGVDIYYSTDLVNWTADVFVTASGNDLEVTRPSGDAARYYILVEPGKTPDFGNFPAPPVTEG